MLGGRVSERRSGKDGIVRSYLHKDVENYFHVVDGTNLDDATARKVAVAYENGEAVLLKGLRPSFDPNFFAAIEWPAIDVLKKLKSVQLVDYHRLVQQGERPANDPAPTRNSAADQYSQILTHVFGGDTGKTASFVDHMRDINGFLKRTISTIFPTYKVKKDLFTWRCADTINENLHLDVYNEDLPDHHVRMFINLDNVQRIWHTSHRLTWLLDHYLHRLPADLVANGTPGRICHALNFEAFGGFEIAGREGAPKHILFFDPGDVWIVDSRKVSHQIFFGRRAVSTEFQIDPASMIDPSRHYFNIVEQARSRHLAQAA